MSAMRFKKCPKCGGNIYEEETVVGKAECCIQCGYEKYIEDKVDQSILKKKEFRRK